MNDVNRMRRTIFAMAFCGALLAAGTVCADDSVLPICDAPQIPGTTSRVDGKVEEKTKLPNTLGTLISIVAEEPNGLVVAEPKAVVFGRVHFAMDASAAESDRWNLVFRGENNQCRAVLEVL